MSENTPAKRTTWDPFAELDLLSRWPGWGTLSSSQSLLRERAAAWAPPMDFAENDDRFVLTMELAGAKKEDVTVEAHENVLTIRGEKRSERTDENEQRRYVERSFGSFSRSFTLPTNADADSVEARFADGVLTVEIAKREEAKPKTIAVG
jgi:HSP20 family protein